MMPFRSFLLFCRSTASYALLLFGGSVLAIFLTVWAMPEPLVRSDEPGVVTRSDSWPVSKRTHMEEGDLWYWIETNTAPQETGVSALDVARAWVPGLTKYHQLELLVWCLLLPGFVFVVVGGGLAAHRTPSPTERLIAAAVPIAVAGLALSMPTDRMYMIMWDASIHWANWLGWTYYDFTVRFFVIAPIVAIGTGVLLLLERARHLVHRHMLAHREG